MSSNNEAVTGIPQRVEAFIAQHGMLSHGATHLVALSGGADSVALLLILKRLGYTIEAAHCNFHLRGAESDRDEAFVRQLCEREGVPLHIAHFDTRGYASLHKVSIELAARRLRYDWFGRLRSDCVAGCVCVAHHRDDSVETLLMNLVRGAGLRGLSGIRPVVGWVGRPLLCLSRSEVEAFLNGVGQTWVTDSTNLTDEATRNIFRHHVVPLLESINPQASAAIARAADHLAEAATLVDAAVQEARCRVVTTTDHGCAVSIEALRSEPAPALLLYEFLRPYGFSRDITDSLLRAEARVGAFFIAGEWELLRDRSSILVQRSMPPIAPLTIPIEGLYVLPSGGQLRVSLCDAKGAAEPSTTPDTVTLDAVAITFPLTVRAAAAGDRFRPFGMKRGTRLVSDFLTDRKVPLFDRRRTLVVTDASGSILWVARHRPDDRYRITPTTTCILTLSYVH